MADWTQITRNLSKHGQFAGQSESEMDAYFEFFAGSDRRITQAIQPAVSRGFRQLAALFGQASLRQVLPGLCSLQATNRQ